MEHSRIIFKPYKLQNYQAPIPDNYIEDELFVLVNKDLPNYSVLYRVVIDNKSAKLEIVEVEGMGGTAYEVGKYTLYAEGDQMLDTGKYVVIWKKQEDGQWKLHRDIWNTSMPMPEKEQESE